jgi:hypothetical protein
MSKHYYIVVGADCVNTSPAAIVTGEKAADLVRNPGADRGQGGVRKV